MASVHKIPLMAQALTATKTGDSVSLEAKHIDFIAHLNCSAINAATTLNAKIQHSPDGSRWYDLATFAALAGSTGSEAVQWTVHVFPQVRAVATLAGVTQTATVDIALYCDRA